MVDPPVSFLYKTKLVCTIAVVKKNGNSARPQDAQHPRDVTTATTGRRAPECAVGPRYQRRLNSVTCNSDAGADVRQRQQLSSKCVSDAAPSTYSGVRVRDGTVLRLPPKIQSWAPFEFCCSLRCLADDKVSRSRCGCRGNGYGETGFPLPRPSPGDSWSTNAACPTISVSLAGQTSTSPPNTVEKPPGRRRHGTLCVTLTVCFSRKPGLSDRENCARPKSRDLFHHKSNVNFATDFLVSRELNYDFCDAVAKPCPILESLKGI